MLPGPDPAATWRVQHAARAIRSGSLVAYPTEGVWGLGCRPDDGDAVRRLLAVKGRTAAKGLILIAAEPGALEPYLGDLPGDAWRAVRASWPGAVTWLVPAAPGAPAWLTGASGRIAVRVTAHPVAAALCRRAGMPIVSTSANRSGQPACRSAAAVRLRFGAAVCAVVDGPLGGLGGPTEIRDALTGAVIRPGPG